MVFSKASVWYEHIVSPLRRLASATSNTLSVSQKQPARASSPAKSRAGEELRSDFPPKKDSVFGDHAEQLWSQKQQQTWGDFLQNPLDIILKDSHAPGHPINLSFQAINKPFSTSAGVQVRRQPPEKGTPRPRIERSSLRNPRLTTHVPKPTSERTREVGSKKYRKYFRDKIIRKGPHFNIRRQNRLCARPCLAVSPVISQANISKNVKGTPYNFGLQEDQVNLPQSSTSRQFEEAVCKTCRAKQIVDSKSQVLIQPQRVSLFGVDKERNIWDTSNRKSPAKLEANEPISPGQTSNAQDGHEWNVSMSNNYPFNSERASDKAQPESNVNSILEKTTYTVIRKKHCGENAQNLPDGSTKKTSIMSMRENLQAAAQGFKCNLWKRAVTGEIPLHDSLRLVNYAPCNVSGKSQ